MSHYLHKITPPLNQDRKQVLIIEDNEEICVLLTTHLMDFDCEVDTAFDGAVGLNKGLTNNYDLIILDLLLPSKDGFDVCKTLRDRQVDTPILLLSARNEEVDKILGLESGADDYMTKPFRIPEFINRTQALLRQRNLNQQYLSNLMNSSTENSLTFGALSIDLELEEVTLNGRSIDLTSREFELLHLLASHPGKSYTKSELLKTIWGYDFQGFGNLVTTHINSLRNKMEIDPYNPNYILTCWEVGYKFNQAI